MVIHNTTNNESTYLVERQTSSVHLFLDQGVNPSQGADMACSVGLRFHLHLDGAKLGCHDVHPALVKLEVFLQKAHSKGKVGARTRSISGLDVASRLANIYVASLSWSLSCRI